MTKYRTIFVTDKRQIDVPEGWDIAKIDLVTPPKGKPQYMILLELRTKQAEHIGFKVTE